MLFVDSIHPLESLALDLDIADDDSQADTIVHSGALNDRARPLSELVMFVTQEASPFCLSMLWNLKEKRVVQNWVWEEEMLRVRVDTELLSRVPAIAMSELAGVSSIFPLIRAVLYFNNYRDELSKVQKPSMAEEEATDFSFLCNNSQFEL